MNLPQVTIQIVSWNSQKYLVGCLKSIFNQTYKDFQVLVIDNNSQDGTADWLRKNYPEVAVFQNHKNLGFAKAHNQGFKLLKSEFVVICNPDVLLEPNWLEIAMSQAINPVYNHYGQFGGKLLQLNVIDLELNDVELTKIIDSCGLEIKRNRLVLERGRGKQSDQYLKKTDVFGHSGALALYRRQALEDCFIKTKHQPAGEYFDEDFFAYKEDVDLSWRLQLLGWSALFMPQAIAYHVRTMSGPPKNKMIELINHRRKQSTLARYYSYRNHFLLLMKNEHGKNFRQDFFYILWLELKKFFYVFLFEWSSLRGLFHAIVMWSKMRVKRKLIMKRAKLEAKDIKKWTS